MRYACERGTLFLEKTCPGIRGTDRKRLGPDRVGGSGHGTSLACTDDQSAKAHDNLYVRPVGNCCANGRSPGEAPTTAVTAEKRETMKNSLTTHQFKVMGSQTPIFCRFNYYIIAARLSSPRATFRLRRRYPSLSKFNPVTEYVTGRLARRSRFHFSISPGSSAS